MRMDVQYVYLLCMYVCMYLYILYVYVLVSLIIEI